MPDNEVKNSEQAQRRSWRDVVAERNPQLNTDDELDVGDYMSDQFAKYDQSEVQRKQFNDMIANDDRAAGILTGLATGMDENGDEFKLESYLMDKYYDIIASEENKEEALKKVAEREAEAAKNAAESAKRAKNLDEALKKSDAELTQAVQAANVDDATIQAMLQWLYGTDEADGLVTKLLKNELVADDWTKLLNAFNMDSALSAAREEGRKRGANGRPGAAHRNLATQAPTDLGSGGGEQEAEETKDPTLRRYASMKPRYQ